MGEIIRNIGVLKIGNESFNIELNEPSCFGNSREVHIQNDKLRVAVGEVEFVQMGAAVLFAQKQLHLLKGIEGGK